MNSGSRVGLAISESRGIERGKDHNRGKASLLKNRVVRGELNLRIRNPDVNGNESLRLR